MSEVYLAITIDTECDKGAGWRVRHPLAFQSVVNAVPNRLEPLFRELGSPATYLLSPEVMVPDECVEVFRDAHRHGAELGTHLHGEFIEPMSDMSAVETAMMQNKYLPEIEAEKLLRLTRLFEEKFGFSPVSFRAGRFGIRPQSLAVLSELGYRVDSSVVPFTEFSDAGGSVAFFGAPLLPYHPHRNNFLAAGDLSILEIPVTMGGTLWSGLPRPLLRTVPRYPRFWGLPVKMMKQKFRPVWMRPTWSSVEQMKRLLHEAVARAGSSPALIVMMFHNVEVEPGCSPYTRDEREVEAYMGRLRGIIEYAVAQGVHCTTLGAMRDLFERKGSPVAHGTKLAEAAVRS